MRALNLKKCLLGASMLTAAAFAATQASATDFDVSKVSMNTSYIVNMNMPGVYSGGVYASPVTLTGKIDGTGPVLNLLGFCVDIFQESTTGNKSPAIDYTSQVITDDSGGHSLSAYDQSRLNWLINYGYDQTDPVVLAEVQVGIWWMLDQSHGLTLSATSSFNSTMLTAAKALGDTTNTLGGAPLKWHNGTVQDFTQQGSVPEPATWGLMVFGFGALGFTLRRRRDSNADSALYGQTA